MAKVIVAHRGFSAIEIELRGRAAHSSQPENGVNAVTMLGRLLAAVEAHDAELASREPHPYAGHGTMMATVVRGGSAPFTLAATASAVVERRTIPGERADAGLVEIEAMMQELGLDGECREVVARGPWELFDAPAAQRLVELLPFAGRVGAPYWMESEMWEATGVPTVVCGPAGGGLHTDVEWVELDQLRTYTDALTALIHSRSPASGAGRGSLCPRSVPRDRGASSFRR